MRRLPIKDGPKRRRATRRQLPNGEVRQWGVTVTNFKREREQERLRAEDNDNNNQEGT